MKVGLFFGSFNPIHCGHLIIAECITNFYTDKVWFIVSPQNPFKKNTDLLNVQSRLLLARAAIKGNIKFNVSDVEVNLSLPSYTINTLQYLDKQYPQHDFYLILGSDNFSTISNWKSSTMLLRNYKIIVYERSGFIINYNNVDSNIQFANSPLINISSTEVRQLIKLKKSIKYIVPQPVISLIESNKYYS